MTLCILHEGSRVHVCGKTSVYPQAAYTTSCVERVDSVLWIVTPSTTCTVLVLPPIVMLVCVCVCVRRCNTLTQTTQARCHYTSLRYSVDTHKPHTPPHTHRGMRMRLGWDAKPRYMYVQRQYATNTHAHTHTDKQTELRYGQSDRQRQIDR